MKHRDLSNNPERAIVDLDSSTGPIYTPDMDHGSIFRIDDTVNVELKEPANLKDGWYIRVEIATLPTNTVRFNGIYTIDGNAIGIITNTAGLYVVEGRYSAARGKLLLRKV